MNVVAEMILNDPAPVTIWATLMLLALPALILLASPHGISRPHLAFLETAGTIRTLRTTRRQRRLEAEEIIRYAGELRTAAERAERSAVRWQENWQDSEDRVDATWQVWQNAQARLERARTAAAFRTPYTIPTPTEYAARERWMHRAVRAAADRAELPATAVADALSGRGWDARLHPVEQELVILGTSAAHLLSEHRRAVTAEQTAWHDAQLARRTSNSLRREAATATLQATTARTLLGTPHPTPSPTSAAIAVRTA